MKLTAAQIRRRAFAEHVASGKSATEAYKLAGYKSVGHAAESAASVLMRNVEVQSLISAATEKASNKRILTATERRELLSEFAKPDPREPVDIRDRIAAVKELNAMDGLHIKKLEHTGPNGQPIGAVLAAVPEDVIRERIAELAKRKGKK